MTYHNDTTKRWIYGLVYTLIVIGFILLLFDFVIACVCIYIVASIMLLIFNLVRQRSFQVIISLLITLALIAYLFYYNG